MNHAALPQRRALVSTVAIVACTMLASPAPASDAVTSSTPTQTSVERARLIAEQARGDVRFLRNVGQWERSILYQATSGAVTARFLRDGVSYVATRDVAGASGQVDAPPAKLAREGLVWNLQFVGANHHPRIEAGGEALRRTSFLLGRDASRWRVDVPDHASITYANLYDGIDFNYHDSGAGAEYDVIVHPGADVSRVRLRYDGVERLAISDGGELVINTRWGEVRESAPRAFQGKSRQVERHVEYVLFDERTYGFRAGSDVDPSQALVIDPLLPMTMLYSTHMRATGLNNNNRALDVDIDHGDLAGGFVYVTGQCDSTYPITTGVFHGGLDAFVTKINQAGTARVYSTYVGGTGDDVGTGIRVNDSGEAWVCATTTSPLISLPATSVAGPLGLIDSFVAKLNATGTGFTYFSVFGGTGIDQAWDIDVDAGGVAYLTGGTRSSNFPVTAGAFFFTNAGSFDAFLVALKPAGVLAFGTYFGGSGIDNGFGIDVSALGTVYFTGQTLSTNFPVSLSAYQPASGGGSDAFAVKVAPGFVLGYATYLGGTGVDVARSVYADDKENAVLIGRTTSVDFPSNSQMLGVPQSANAGGGDAFVAELLANGNKLEWSTYLGGASVIG